MNLTGLRDRFTFFGRRSRRLALTALAASMAVGCASGQKPPVATRATGPTCANVDFPIYFAKGSDQLTDPARQAITAGAGEVKGCQIAEVDVFGLADVDGPAGRNLALSRRRANAVAQALVGSGMPAPLFDVQGLGESGAKTAHGRPAMLQRKTEVVIRVASRTP